MLALLESMRDSLSAYLPIGNSLFQAVTILLLGLVGHLVLRAVVNRMHRLSSNSNQPWDDVLVVAAETPLRTVFWVIVVYFALNSISGLPGAISGLLTGVYDTALVVMLTWFLQRLIRGAEAEFLRQESLRDKSSDRAAVHATAQLTRIALWVLAGLMILQTMGISISGLLAFGGIGGIAVGFAAKDLLANFFGGLSIYLDRPFTTGDWVRSPDRNIEGTVEYIGWRLTRIRTFDQRPLYVPNSIFSQISVENPSRMLNRRIYETIGVRYQDSHKMPAIVADVKAMLKAHQAIDKQRTLIVNFVSFGASSLDFFIYTFTRTTAWVEYHEIKQDVLLKVLGIVHQHDADVAFPTRTLQVEQIEAEALHEPKSGQQP